jgi:serine/threonine-protein kinase
MKPLKKSSPSSKRYPPNSFMGKLRKRRILETLAAFIGGGWLTWEAVHWILVEHYNFPEKLLDITLVSLIGGLLCTLTWRWFGGKDKKRKRFKPELILIPLIILITAFFDIRLTKQIGEPESEKVSETKWENSIAVMPFANITGDENQEYLCDGLTEELINRLSNVQGLKVPASTSVFAFKGKRSIVQEVGEKLQVEKILEGSVRQSGDQLRISVQLINVSDGFHVWSEQYPMQMDDLFDIQDKIALNVIEKLKIQLLEKEKTKLTKNATSNFSAFESYTKGKLLRYTERPKEMLMARDYLEEAIRRDPEYAAAYAGLAENYMVLGLNSVLPRNEAATRAKEAAKKALKLDDDISEAHVSMGVIRMVFDWDWKESEKELRRAIALNPNNFDAHREYALLLFRTYRYDVAEKEFFLSIEIDPLNALPLRDLRVLYLSRGWYEKAEDVGKKLQRVEPDWADFFKEGHYSLEKAMTDVQEQGRYPYQLSRLAIAHFKSEELSSASKLVQELESLYREGLEGNVAVYLALTFYEMGEKEKALSWLERAVEKKAPTLINLSYPIWFESLHKEPRFLTCLDLIGFK